MNENDNLPSLDFIRTLVLDDVNKDVKIDFCSTDRENCSIKCTKM